MAAPLPSTGTTRCRHETRARSTFRVLRGCYVRPPVARERGAAFAAPEPDAEPALDLSPALDLCTAITDRREHVTSIIGSAPQRPQDQRRQAHFHEWHPAALRPAFRDERPSVQGILAPREACSRPADRDQSLTRERPEEGQIRS